MEKIKLLFIVGLSLITGFIWGTAFHIEWPRSIWQYDRIITIDVIKKGDDIWIIDHRTGQLIFEYNRLKDADKVRFKEYQDLLSEVLLISSNF